MLTAYESDRLKVKSGGLKYIGFLGILVITISALLVSCRPAIAAPDLLDRVQEEDLEQVIRLRVGRSKVLRTPFPIQRVSVADPDVADIVLISNRELYINANSPGVTNVSLWGKQRFSSSRISVEPDISILKEKLFKILPKEKIAVEAAGRHGGFIRRGFRAYRSGNRPGPGHSVCRR